MARSLVDFEVMAGRDDAVGHYVRSDEYRHGLIEQIRRTRRYGQALYAASAILAFIALRGGFPSGTSVTALGVTLPIGILTQQAVAVLAAALYGTFLGYFMSQSLLGGALAKLMAGFGNESWDYLIAPRDGLYLWATLLRPKHVGYASPPAERALAVALLLWSLATLLLHSALVGIATLASLLRAVATHDPLAIALGGFALAGVLVAFGAFTVAGVVPLTYRQRQGLA